MIKKVNNELYTYDDLDALETRLSQELEERIEMACWVNVCGCKGEYAVAPE